jgi:uncharacterized protein (TIGR00369 family)
MISPPFEPRDPDFDRRVRRSFDRQAAMRTLGATLAHVAPGEVDIELTFRTDLTQQHGYLHAGVVTAVVDSACGYAALSLMEPGAAVLSVEFKLQLLAPAQSPRFLARGRVVRPGRSLTVVAGELCSERGEVLALLNGTMIAVRDRPELAD